MSTDPWKPDVFIYHSPCDDGFGAAWAVHQRWGDEVEYLPGTYGQPAPDVTGKNVLIGDFSYKRPQLEAMAATAASIVILDHHKTAQEDLAPFTFVPGPDAPVGPEDIPGHLGKLAELGRPPIFALFDMERSGARMVWDFCHAGKSPPDLIAMIEDRDLWRFSDPDTKPFSLYLRSHPYNFAVWTCIHDELERDPFSLMDQARAVERFYDQKVREMVRGCRYMTIDSHSVPVVNCSWAFASDVAHALLELAPDAPFSACYYDRGDGARSYSLRSEDGRVDVSAIARRYGGGGHRNAAGFEVPAP